MIQYPPTADIQDDDDNDDEPRNLSMNRLPMISNRFPSDSIIDNEIPMPIPIEPIPDDLTIQQPIADVVSNEQQPIVPQVAVSPDISLVFAPHLPNASTTPDPNPMNIDQTQRTEQYAGIASGQPPHHHPQIRHQSGARCPYAHRRLSTSNYHSFYPQNMRPAYAPHEMLWFRQQNNQEMLRRHYINSMTAGINETPPTNTFGYVSNRGTGTTANGVCMSCDQQHPIGHPNRRVRPHVCPLNLVCILSIYIQFYKHFVFIKNFSFFVSTEFRESTTTYRTVKYQKNYSNSIFFDINFFSFFHRRGSPNHQHVHHHMYHHYPGSTSPQSQVHVSIGVSFH